jgi:hypothetical protein
MQVSRRIVLAGAAVVLTLGGFLGWRRFAAFPPETTPEGVYFRIGSSLNQDDPRALFAYLEDEAQHDCYTIRDYRKQASLRVAAAYPEPERTKLLAQYAPQANAPDGADIWVELARQRGFVARLKRDLSGAAKVEIVGDRATIETARGTRYSLRRRDNGIWGLTLFTAELRTEAERAANDAEVVDKAADDYARARK